jgi:hypothetical protein
VCCSPHGSVGVSSCRYLDVEDETPDSKTYPKLYISPTAALSAGPGDTREQRVLTLLSRRSMVYHPGGKRTGDQTKRDNNIVSPRPKNKPRLFYVWKQFGAVLEQMHRCGMCKSCPRESGAASSVYHLELSRMNGVTVRFVTQSRIEPYALRLPRNQQGVAWSTARKISRRICSHHVWAHRDAPSNCV